MTVTTMGGHMERKARRNLAGALVAALILFAALSLAPQAYADMTSANSQGVDLLAQTSGANTTKANAQTLKAGGAATGTFEYKNPSGYGGLESYWYKFKTSSRNSVYKLVLKSLDRDMICIYRYDASGNELDWERDANSSYTVFSTNQVNYISTNKSDILYKAKKKAWLYFKFAPQASTYVKSKFSIKVTEHPVINPVTGLKAANTAKKSLSVTWKNQANATKYQVKYRVKGGTWKSVSTSKSKVTLKKLASGKKYQVRVRAYCKGGYNTEAREVVNWGEWSLTKTFKTKE